MSADPRLRRAVDNNAQWRDALARAHGAATEQRDGCWINLGAAPPYTPQLITLEGEEHAPQQLAAIERVCALARAPGLHVKDSFACLDLAPLGFDVLFEATWIASAPDPQPPPATGLADSLQWSLVGNDAELADWEAAWRTTAEAIAELGGYPRVFLPSLLEQPGVQFLTGRRGRELVAIAALNRSDRVVGLSNAIAREADSRSLFAGCRAIVRSLHPGLELVGYERGDDLIAAQHAGFTPLHPLRVWRSRAHE